MILNIFKLLVELICMVDIHKKIYGHIDANVDERPLQMEGGDWETFDGQKLEKIQRYFFDEVENIYLQIFHQ